MIDREAAEALRAVVADDDAVLFTGAGFSAGARDAAGAPLPTSGEMLDELWALAFPGERRDDSSLADLYEAACVRDRGAVARYLVDRLTVGPAPIPDHLGAWMGAPWRRIYTLDVDDLEVAVQRQGHLRWPLRTVSALAPDAAPPGPPGAIDVVHLNGVVGHDVDEVTFSPLQYAERLGRREREYERLARDLAEAPCVFVGTTLDESILWQHVAAPPLRSFLVTRSLTRARQVLLASVGITWIAATAEEVAALVFS